MEVRILPYVPTVLPTVEPVGNSHMSCSKNPHKDDSREIHIRVIQRIHPWGIHIWAIQEIRCVSEVPGAVRAAPSGRHHVTIVVLVDSQTTCNVSSESFDRTHRARQTVLSTDSELGFGRQT